ncbi:MAG: phosphoglucosamine mutase [Bacilli bacterium]|nr:phosphoglucosamine mutase [Bacilli bacterium]
MKKYFGTDGIRGRAYEFLTPELAYLVGLSLKPLGCEEVIIGRDTRESGKMLFEGIEKGAIDAGIKVWQAEIVSTPMLSYLSKEKNAFGVMITGSHNPYQDNGIKIFKYGKKLSGTEEELIEAVLNGIKKVELNNGKRESDQLSTGLDIYSKLFQDILVPSKLKIGLDFANGATYEIGKRIFQSYPNIEVIGDKPDGKNINQGFGSTALDNLIKLVGEKDLDLGFAFDGDGDRIMVVNHDGRVIDGDYLIYIFGTYLKDKELLTGNAVVLTKMSNLGIIKALQARGIEVLLTDVGDKYVFNALEENGYILGGENSGHIINQNLLDTGDGLLNAIYLIKILEESKMSLEELTKEVIMYPERTVNVRDVKKEILKEEEVKNKIENIKIKLGSNGKVVVRASGTEPLIRVSVSAESYPLVDQIIEEIIYFLRNVKVGEI